MPRTHTSARLSRRRYLNSLAPGSPHRALWAAAMLAATLFLPAKLLAREQEYDQPAKEIVADLDAGRVVLGVAKDGIVIATLENPIEPSTEPPEIIPLFGQRAAVLLGAADWWLPEVHRELADLNQELPTLPSPLRMAGPHLQMEAGAGHEATDIEQIAGRLETRLNWIFGQIHGNLHLQPNAPLVEMLLADYAADYGPEVWLIKYSIHQEPLQGGYWQSRALEPHYTQLWPPAKDQPHSLMEIDYPAQATAHSLAQLLAVGDPRLTPVASSSAEFREVSAAILKGDLKKITAVELAAFLRAALRAIAPPQARMVEAEVNREKGIGWFLLPPPRAKRPGAEQLRPPGAPTLRHPPGKPHAPGSLLSLR